MGAGTASCTLAPRPPVPRVISTRAGMGLLRDLDAFAEASISMIESGMRKRPSLPTLKRLARAPACR